LKLAENCVPAVAGLLRLPNGSKSNVWSQPLPQLAVASLPRSSWVKAQVWESLVPVMASVIAS
jgi:hypothetical protein